LVLRDEKTGLQKIFERWKQQHKKILVKKLIGIKKNTGKLNNIMAIRSNTFTMESLILAQDER
jgi:tryptophan 2,3-dioxygenase